MGRKLANSTPTVINTKFVSLDESFFIAADGQTEQWYYDNEAKYAPNRHLTPLTLTPKLSVKDKDTNISYSVDAGTVSFYTVQWYALEYADGSYVETAITNLTDSSDADYVLSGFNLIIKKNVSYSHGVTIRCLATYKDPRDANTTCTTQGTVLLTTNRDAKVELPEVTIISPSARAFNPLTDYKTVDGVEVQDSLFDFEAAVSNKPTSDSVIQYRVDGGGTEELVEEDGVMTALPSMDIRYPDGDVMTDQSFLYRVTANGTKPNVSGMAFLTALRGNTVKFNQLLPTSAKSYSKTYSSDTTTYYVNMASALSVPIRNGHYYYMSVNIQRTISGNDYLYVNFSVGSSNYFGGAGLANGDANGVRSSISVAAADYNTVTSRYTNYGGKRGFSAGDSVSIDNFELIDLTEIFGSDAQIASALGITTADITTATGVAAFETWLAQNVGQRDYYAYNAGSLVPTRFEAIKTTGDDWESTTPLAIASITGKLNGTGESVTVFPDGMKRVGDVYDEIKVENGVLKAIKRVGSVDLGTLTWTTQTTYGYYAVPPSMKPSTKNAICWKYPYLGLTAITTGRNTWEESDKVLSCGTFVGSAWTRRLLGKDSSYETVADFKASLSGVILYYELATPQEYVLDPIQDPFIFEWFGISGNQEVKADTLPWYVSGQGTSRLTVDAMFGEHINVVAAAKMLNGQLSPSRAYAAVTWRIPDVDTHVMSVKGGTVRNESDSFTFETICNVKGQMLSENVKNEHLRFNWKYRRSDSTTENDAGWGQSVTVPSASLLNVRTVAGKLPSTHVYPYPFLLGAWEPQTSTDPVPYSQPTTTKDGVTYVRTIN